MTVEQRIMKALEAKFAEEGIILTEDRLLALNGLRKRKLLKER